MNFQNHLEKRKFEYLKDFYRPKDWELEFKNFLKTPPSSQVLDDHPTKLPLNSDENRVVLGLLRDKKLPNFCFVDFKNELEMRKAKFYNNHKVKDWNIFFMHETLKFDDKELIKFQNKDSLNNNCQCHIYDDNAKLK